MPYDIPSSAPKSEELIKTLTRIAASDEINEFELRKLDREARKLMTADAAAAHTVLGGIASLRGRTEAVREHHEIALKLSGNSGEALTNYAVSLSKVGEMTEAFKATMEALNRVPNDQEKLLDAIGAACWSAHFREGRNLYRRWNEAFPDLPLADESIMTKVTDAVDRGAFSEEAAQEVVRIAHGIRREANVHTARNGMVAEHAEPDSFLFELHVCVSPVQAVGLNEKLADRIVDEPDLMGDPGRKFMPVFIGTRVHVSHSEATS